MHRRSLKQVGEPDAGQRGEFQRFLFKGEGIHGMKTAFVRGGGKAKFGVRPRRAFALSFFPESGSVG